MFHGKKCERGHPIDSDRPCQLCLQEDRERDKRDEDLAQALERLVRKGRLSSSILPSRESAPTGSARPLGDA